ncbi:MAG: type II 3-dehydroquinate dehydratase [Cyclobacteriaceae bacterium]
MQKLIIINGPNLNLLGTRETDIYGNRDFDSFFQELQADYPDIELFYFQSNHEGELIDKIHEIGFSYDGIIINAAGYSHTSVAIADALAAVTAKSVEVHISNVYKREAFRHHSYLTGNCIGLITGLGLYGYRAAIEFFKQQKHQ